MSKVLKKVQVAVSAEVAIDSQADDNSALRFAIPYLVENIRNHRFEDLTIQKGGDVSPEPALDSRGNISSSPASFRNRRLIGYQIVSNDDAGVIPCDLYSFMVLSEKAVNQWLVNEKRTPTGNWKCVPVYSGDIEEPVIISNLD